jgi:SAM-dependent methyltransferase
MVFLNGLKQRAAEPEFMDEVSAGGEELREALRHLRRLNRIFGAAGPVLFGVRTLWAAAGKPECLSILDIGSGSGEINRKLLRWADRNGIRLSIRLADIAEEACAEAKLLYSGEPRIRVQRCDLFQLPEGSADIVTASQFVHHFPSEALPEVAGGMLRASRIGAVISDIHRHWVPWLAVWLTCRLVSRNRYIRHDGPLSVAKGFRGDDWRNLEERLKLPGFSYFWRPLFRYVVIAKKADTAQTWPVRPEWR